MRLVIAMIAALGCAGCDQVFRLRDRAPLPPSDAAPKPSPTCLGPGDRVELPLLADTYLEAGDTSPNGSEPLARVSTTSSLLARFDRGDVQFLVLELDLSHADSAVGCDNSGQCATCDLGTTGAISLFLVRPDWDEASATHTERMAGVAWTAPGATGADRSVRLTQTTYAGTDLSTSAFYMDTQLGAGWPPGLSLLLGVETAGAGTFGTDEGANACGQAQPPKLSVTCTAASTCGEGTRQANEDCDDGNTDGGDGCSAACRFEICGNRIIDVGEECDDGDLINTNGCTNACLCDNAC